MMKSRRNNRLKASWVCPHCKAQLGTNQFRLSVAHPGSVICPTEGSVFLDLPDIRRRERTNLLEAQQMMYVAVTRPSQRLIVVE